LQKFSARKNYLEGAVASSADARTIFPKLNNQTIFLKGLALAGIVLVFELILMILAGTMIYYADQVARNERKASEIVAQSNRVLIQSRKAFAASMDRAYHQPQGAQADLIGALRKLKELVHENHELEKEVSEIEDTYWEAQNLLAPVRNRSKTNPRLHQEIMMEEETISQS
jgi:hypothetical protein